MRRKIGLLVTLCLLFALGRGWAVPAVVPDESPRQIAGDVLAVTKRFTRMVPPPVSTGTAAIVAKIDIRFPELTSRAGTNAAAETINAEIRHRLLATMAGQTPATMDQLTETFARAYEDSVRKAPGLPGAWFLRFEADVRHADEDLFCVRLLQSVFTGGAHPASSITYLVFSMKTGALLPLSAVVPESKGKELTEMAERRFRQVRKLLPDVPFDRAGFRFAENRFALNRNFLVSTAGLAFCFNQGEVAPYARGVTEFVIPWSDLALIVDGGGLAGRFLKR